MSDHDHQWVPATDAEHRRHLIAAIPEQTATLDICTADRDGRRCPAVRVGRGDEQPITYDIFALDTEGVTVGWPEPHRVIGVLEEARDQGTDGWRTMAEIAGALEYPEYSHVLPALDELWQHGQVTEWVTEDGPRRYRYRRDGEARHQLHTPAPMTLADKEASDYRKRIGRVEEARDLAQKLVGELTSELEAVHLERDVGRADYAHLFSDYETLKEQAERLVRHLDGSDGMPAAWWLEAAEAVRRIGHIIWPPESPAGADEERR